MLSTLFLSLSTWDEYFRGKAHKTYQSPTPYKTQLPNLADGVYVLECSFQEAVSETHGGALKCESVTYLVVEKTRFFNCKANKLYGGAIYFNNQKFNSCGVAIASTCVIGCISGVLQALSYGQFCHIHAENKVIKSSSIIYCDDYEKNSYYTMYLEYGTLNLDNDNISNNRIMESSGFSVSFLNSFNVQFTQISNNEARSGNCINIIRSSLVQLRSCNFIQNTANTLIKTAVEMTLKDTSFQKNVFTSFTSPTGRIIWDGCSIDAALGNIPNVDTIKMAASPFSNKIPTLDCATTQIKTPTKRVRCNQMQRCKQFSRFGLNRAFL